MAKIIPPYFMQNKLAIRVLRLIDILLPFFLRSKQGPIEIPKKILLSHPAHLGDVILMTALLKPLKENYPHIKIGVVVGSHSKQVVEGHPDIDWIHVVDHPKLNRHPKNRLLTYLKTRKQALREIKNVGYDISVDCNFHFPNLAPLFWRAKIKTRLGFVTAGFSPFLTHAKPSENTNQSVAYFFLSLLKQIPNFLWDKPLKSSLPEVKPFPQKNYVVIHMGASNPIKQWPLSKWKALIASYAHEKLIFTGTGHKENDAIESVRRVTDTNLCDKLSWQELVALIKYAKKVITVDTSVSHIAAAFDIPSVVLLSGIYPSSYWAPLSTKALCLTHTTPCSPCFQGRGCPTMPCLHNITPE